MTAFNRSQTSADMPMTAAARIGPVICTLGELLEPAFHRFDADRDAHPEVGNNAILANRLGCDRRAPLGPPPARREDVIATLLSDLRQMFSAD